MNRMPTPTSPFKAGGGALLPALGLAACAGGG